MINTNMQTQIDGYINKLLSYDYKILNMYQSTLLSIDKEKQSIQQIQGMLNKMSSIANIFPNWGNTKIVSNVSDNITVSPTSSSPTGTFSFIINRIATNHKVVSNIFYHGTNNINSSFITLSVIFNNGASENFNISLSGNTDVTNLYEISDYINKNSSYLSSTALEINNNGDMRLIFSSKKIGNSNAIKHITIKNENGDDITDIFGLDELTNIADDINGGTLWEDNSISKFNYNLLNAEINYDGITVTRENNTFNNLIPNTTISLRGVGKVIFTIEENDKEIINTFSEITSLYNSIKSTVYNKNSNNSLRYIVYNLRKQMNFSVNGIQIWNFDKEGNAVLKEDALQSLLSTDDRNEIITELKNVISDIKETIDNEKEKLSSSIFIYDSKKQMYDRKIKEIKQMIEIKKDYYLKQVSNLLYIKYQMEEQMKQMTNIIGTNLF